VVPFEVTSRPAEGVSFRPEWRPAFSSVRSCGTAVMERENLSAFRSQNDIIPTVD